MTPTPTDTVTTAPTPLSPAPHCNSTPVSTQAACRAVADPAVTCVASTVAASGDVTCCPTLSAIDVACVGYQWDAPSSNTTYMFTTPVSPQVQQAFTDYRARCPRFLPATCSAGGFRPLSLFKACVLRLCCVVSVL